MQPIRKKIREKIKGVNVCLHHAVFLVCNQFFEIQKTKVLTAMLESQNHKQEKVINYFVNLFNFTYLKLVPISREIYILTVGHL